MRQARAVAAGTTGQQQYLRSSLEYVTGGAQCTPSLLLRCTTAARCNFSRGIPPGVVARSPPLSTARHERTSTCVHDQVAVDRTPDRSSGWGAARHARRHGPTEYVYVPLTGRFGHLLGTHVRAAVANNRSSGRGRRPLCSRPDHAFH